jgi:hypothetical protein
VSRQPLPRGTHPHTAPRLPPHAAPLIHPPIRRVTGVSPPELPDPLPSRAAAERIPSEEEGRAMRLPHVEG